MAESHPGAVSGAPVRGSYLTTATDGPGPGAAVSYDDGATTGAGPAGLCAAGADGEKGQRDHAET